MSQPSLRDSLKRDAWKRFFRARGGNVAIVFSLVAPVIVMAMGATLEAFPKDQVSALVERISGEIQDDARRVQFQQRMIQVIRQQAA